MNIFTLSRRVDRLDRLMDGHKNFRTLAIEFICSNETDVTSSIYSHGLTEKLDSVRLDVYSVDDLT